MPDNKINLQTLKFPLTWHGRLILGTDSEAGVESRISQVLEGCGLRGFQIQAGAFSKGGNYRTYLLTVSIPELAVFRAVTASLGTIPGVKMLL